MYYFNKYTFPAWFSFIINIYFATYVYILDIEIIMDLYN